MDVRKCFFYIKERVSSDWKDLAFHLGFEQPKIDNIDGRNKDYNSCCMDLLEEWLKRNGESATVEVLMEALPKANLQSVLDGLKKEVVGPTMNPQPHGSSRDKDLDDKIAESTDHAEMTETDMNMTETSDQGETVLYEITPHPAGGTPLLPVVVKILEQVLPSVKTPKDMFNYTSALETLSTITVDNTFSNTMLEQIKSRTRSITDLLTVAKAVKRLERFKGIKVSCVKTGCLVFYLQCTEMDGLGELWFLYKRGELDNLLHGSLISEETLQQLSAESISVKTTINTEDFRKALVYILTSPDAKGQHITRLPQEYPFYQPRTHSTSSVLDVLHLDQNKVPKVCGERHLREVALPTQGDDGEEDLIDKLGNLQIAGPICAPSDDVTRINNNEIHVMRTIGPGTFGTVYLASYNGRQVAIKKLGFEDYPWRLPEPKRILRESVLEEAAVMQQIQTENVVQLIGICLEPENYIIIMEYMPKGSLLDLLLSNTPLTWTQLLQLSTDAARGLCSLHYPRGNCPGRVHGNLTTSTYLLDANMRVKLSNFCSTKTKSSVKRYSKFRRGRSTVAYVAPENLKDINAKQTVVSEVFSFGIVLWEIACRRIAHEAIRYDEKQIHKFVLEERRKEGIPANCNKSLVAIIERCRDFEETERPTMQDVVKFLESALVNCPSP